MATLSKIEWTEATWNPVTGCSKISAGCKNCYAERMAKRLKSMGVEAYKNGFEVSLQEHALTTPLKWKKPKIIFVNSMSDLFHKDVPSSFIYKVFEVMNKCPQHTFQVLTKRPSRLSKLHSKLNWTSNIWMGVSVETPKFYSRIEKLSRCGAAIKFLSCEPLLSSLPDIPLANIDWVIAGGESGPNSREMKPEWVREIRDQCDEEGISFFFKQWGGKNKKAAGRTLDGVTHDSMPSLQDKNDNAA